MTYTIEFTCDTAEKMFTKIWTAFNNSEQNFKDKDLERNIRNTSCFQGTVNLLRFIGAKTDVGTYLDNGFDRIGFASINGYEFVKNGEFKFEVLKEALNKLV